MHPSFSRCRSFMQGAVLCALLIRPGTMARAADSPATDWALLSKTDSVTIYSRTRAGSPIKEFKAVGDVDAPPRRLMAVLDDVDAYTRFMPYITQCRVIKRDAGSLVSYQRISPPFCTDRDYSIRVRHEIKSTPAGKAYICRWELANALGPAECSEALRVKVNEGSWLLEPGDGNTVHATYCVYTDSGGSLPGWLAGKANQVGIGKLFDAIRKQVKEAKYSAIQ